MTDRPIIFSAPMVRALLDGRKTQTRRVLGAKSGVTAAHKVEKSGAHWIAREYDRAWPVRAPYATGDRLWVREAWALSGDFAALKSDEWAGFHNPRAMLGEHLTYLADADAYDKAVQAWRSPIHMPRWASRITLLVTDVRVQRLQDISEDDAFEEGVTRSATPLATSRAAFRDLWNSIHGPGAWDANPWVAAISFERMT